ncbi:BLUF domain-containing protein [Sphingomonas japonica]|uniref:BLUF domain-containing protein n=1 Tax=Sphingomonas japonica TaxID=511662 RepID=A0ABX0U3S6_9SPHN|nr:BLUF domain-containing protein [Sphingomonas japonica]NIJ24321.1 hypothetical protein [Sphingomonas japonica]
MLQLVYVSSVHPVGSKPDIDSILTVSRRNNRRDAITGLLYCDTARFLQVLEGPDRAVETAYERIRQDDRHRAAVILSRRQIETREFGSWEMAHRSADIDAETFILRISTMVENAAPRVRATFESFALVRNAAA